MATIASLPLAVSARPQHSTCPIDTKSKHAPRTQRGAFSFVRYGEGLEAASGDLCDVVSIGRDRVAVLVADVAGHGAGAAAIAQVVRDIWRSTLRSAMFVKPAAVLTSMNRALCALEALDSRFVAATCAIVDSRRQSIAFARAGAPYPIHRRFYGDRQLLRPRGMALGVDPLATFETRRLAMETGDAFYLVTDGVEPLLTAQAEGHFVPETGDVERTLAPDELVANSRWFAELARHDAHTALAGLAQRRRACLASGLLIDDVTALAIQAR
ncbi:MAG: serine/threonine-protein phosphatase [Phycisphaerales bacterium]|nr:serine/threonine-protein phosphatase [Phycisphaerales bacterium]